MSRFSRSSRFAKQKQEEQVISKDFASMGLIHKEQKGAFISKGTRPLKRDTFLSGTLTKGGYYCPEECSTLNTELGHLEYETMGGPLPSLRQRASMRGPKHPNDKPQFLHADKTWGNAKRFSKNKNNTASPGPVYLPQVGATSQMKRSTGVSLPKEKETTMVVVHRGPMGKKIVKPRNRDRAWFLNSAMHKGGYMYKLEDPSEIADIGHAVNKDITNETIYNTVKPSVAGLGKAPRFVTKLNPEGAPGPKYNPSYNIDSRRISQTAHRFGVPHADKKVDRSKALATGIIKGGVVLHQGPGNVNDIGPGQYAPTRLFDNARKQIELGFGEAQMEWMAKQRKQKQEAARQARLRKRRLKRKKKRAEAKAAKKRLAEETAKKEASEKEAEEKKP